MLKINNRRIYQYRGIIHIHTNLSDGTGTVEEIALAAKKAGLDFVIITDHNNLEAKEGYINGVCVIKGTEISPLGCNHYLALDTKTPIDFHLPLQEITQKVREQGGFGFAAHPDEGQNRKNKHTPIKWLDKDITPDGVEIWNWFSEWADNYCDKNLPAIAYAYLFHHSLVKKPNPNTLKWWDELNNSSENIVPATGGTDAHAMKIRDYLLPVTIFPYNDLFKTITNIINLEEELSEDFDTAKRQILSSVKSGKNLIINRKTGCETPVIYIENTESTAFCGESVNFDNNCSINVTTNRVFEIKLVCNGIVIFKKKAKSIRFPITQKGKYRVELTLGNKGFAYSNPIAVK